MTVNMGVIFTMSMVDCSAPNVNHDSEGVLAEGGPHPVVPGGSRIALVEDEIDYFQDRRQTGGKLGASRDLEGNALFGKRALGAHDALRDGRFRHKKRARDLCRCQTSEQAQSERNSRLGREHWMAGDEHEAEQVITNIVIEGRIEIRHNHLPGCKLAGQFFMLAIEQRSSAEVINCTMFGRGH